MKTPTNHVLVLSIEQMEAIIAEMKDNKRCQPTMSNQAKFKLQFNTDCNAHEIDGATGYQFSSYAECNGMFFSVSL